MKSIELSIALCNCRWQHPKLDVDAVRLKVHGSHFFKYGSMGAV